MTEPTITLLSASFKEPDNSVWVINTSDIPLPQEQIKDVQIINFGPKRIGGNHKHPRTEWFIGIGELLFVWLDKNGQKHEEKMNPNGQLKLITVPPFLPHAVINTSEQKDGLLYEMADEKLTNVEEVIVI